MAIKCIELCAGIGGLGFGLRRVIEGFRVVAYCEHDEHAVNVLSARMRDGRLDSAPIWDDVTTFPSEEYRSVDIVTGGYPCQPFSRAGKRRGADDERHLWPYIRNIIGAVKPFYAFFENVEGHMSLGLPTVISDLAELGYESVFGLFDAEEVGAPHLRKRVFILAKHPDAPEIRFKENTTIDQWPSVPGEPRRYYEPARLITIMDDTPTFRRRKGHDNRWTRGGSVNVSAIPGEDDGKPNGWYPESGVGMYADGLPAGLDKNDVIRQLQLLGNAVVPAQAAKAFVVLYEQLAGVLTIRQHQVYNQT